jgi:hypothetical protein
MGILSPKYTPLARKTSEIRLLHLAGKGVKQKNTDSQCTIGWNFSTVSLDDYPSYEALSYVWGEPHKDNVYTRRRTTGGGDQKPP